MKKTFALFLAFALMGLTLCRPPGKAKGMVMAIPVVMRCQSQNCSCSSKGAPMTPTRTRR